MSRIKLCKLIQLPAAGYNTPRPGSIKVEEDDNGDMDEEDDNHEDSEEGCRDIKPESRHSSDSNVKPPYSYVAMIGKY